MCASLCKVLPRKTILIITHLLLSTVIFPLSCAIEAGGQQPFGVDPLDPGHAKLVAAPASIRQVQGLYPTSVSLLLWPKGCDPTDKKSQQFNNLGGAAAPHYSAAVTGAGLTATVGPTATKCLLPITLTIPSGKADPGYYIIQVIDTATNGDKTDQGYAILSLMDPAAGPVPANQQVDVIWGVLSEHLCRDNFGRHVSTDVFCIEVKIGNNTGHSIQLAGVGFKPRKPITIDGESEDEASPNISYQTVRAAAQSHQLFNSRSTFINSSTAIGILMASFNPFFRASLATTRWAVGTAVVGTDFPSAISTIFPDQSTTQLNNLDDQTFRDGLMIPNNTQIRTMVFVEKKQLMGSGKFPYARACGALYGNFDGDQPASKEKAEKEKAEKAKQKCNKTKDDPAATKLALGNLVIVGNEIDYIQRLVVDQTVTSQAVGVHPMIGIVTVDATLTKLNASITSNVSSSVSAVILPFNTSNPTLTLQPQPDPTKLQFTASSALSANTSYTLLFTFADGSTQSVTLLTPKA